MKDHSSENDRFARLRSLAEERKAVHEFPAPSPMSEQDCQQLVHELQVHQIELEMQNEELRVTQEQLRESLEKYADLYEFAPVGYVTSDARGSILEANLTFASQLGLDRSRLINTALLLYAPVSDRSIFRAHLDQVLESGERHSCKLRLERQNGAELFVQLDSLRALQSNGSPLFRTSVTDISARIAVEDDLVRLQGELEKRVEKRTTALSGSNRKFKRLFLEFQTIINAISDTLILLSPTMDLLWMNGESSLELDKDMLDPVGQYCYALLYDRGALPKDCPVRRCFETTQKEAATISFKGYILDVRAFPIKDEDTVSSVLLLISDISEKIAMQAEAIEAAHLASLGELAAGVAHEINNPITGIINYGQILINECSADSLEKDIGTRIVKEGERVGRIVKTLLSYAKHDQRKTRRPASIAAILNESIVLTQAQIRKEGIAFKISLPGGLPPVNVNFQQIQQCMINIINNARYALNLKYSGRHENKRLDITGCSVSIGGQAYVRVVFHDRGVGIAADTLADLTKPFYSTKPYGLGTGLGLSITQKIITEHAGNLLFKSVQGEYTKVIVELPVHPDSVEGKT